MKTPRKSRNTAISAAGMCRTRYGSICAAITVCAVSAENKSNRAHATVLIAFLSMSDTTPAPRSIHSYGEVEGRAFLSGSSANTADFLHTYIFDLEFPQVALHSYSQSRL